MVACFRFFRGAAILTAAAAMLYLAVPRFIAAVVTLPSGPILNKIQTNKNFDREGLDILVQSQERGLEWNESSRRWTDLGLARILLADYADDEDGRIAQLELAAASLNRGLSLGPANPFAWARLAYIDMTVNGLSPAVAEKLLMAITRAPYEGGRLVFARLRLVFLAWPYFDVTSRSLIMDQIRYAWTISPKGLVSMAAELGRAGLVRAALFTGPDDLEQFETLLGQYHRKKNK